MEENIYKVFALINEKDEITDITGGILTDTAPTGYIQIDEGVGDKYAHCQGNYFEKPYREDYLDGTLYFFKYREVITYVDKDLDEHDSEDVIIEKTAEEIEAEKAEIEAHYVPPTTVEDRVSNLEVSQELQDEAIDFLIMNAE